MNIVASVFIGGILAVSAVIGGVHAKSGEDQKPVQADRLFSYSDR